MATVNEQTDMDKAIHPLLKDYPANQNTCLINNGIMMWTGDTIGDEVVRMK